MNGQGCRETGRKGGSFPAVRGALSLLGAEGDLPLPSVDRDHPGPCFLDSARAAQNHSTPRGTAQSPSIARHSTAQPSTEGHSAAPLGAQHGTAQHELAPHRAAKHHLTPHGTAQQVQAGQATADQHSFGIWLRSARFFSVIRCFSVIPVSARSVFHLGVSAPCVCFLCVSAL